MVIAIDPPNGAAYAEEGNADLVAFFKFSWLYAP